MKKWFTVILVAITVVVFFIYQQKSQSILNGIAQVNGRIEIKRLDIATLYSGRVEEILVKEGQEVKKNQPLARLSSSQAQSQYESALAQITIQQQRVTIAKLDLDNAIKLRKSQLISQSELTTKQAKYDEAIASLDQALAQSRTAQSQHEDMTIRSPIEGRVEYKIAEVGNVLATGGKVVSLLDLTDISMNVFLTAHQSNQIRINDEARIRIDGTDYVFPAKVTFIASNAQFTPKSVETAEERAKLMFKVKLQLPQNIAKQHRTLLKGGQPAVGYVKYDEQANWLDNLAINLPQGD